MVSAEDPVNASGTVAMVKLSTRSGLTIMSTISMFFGFIRIHAEVILPQGENLKGQRLL